MNMDSSLDRLETSSNENGNLLYAFCTTDSVRVGFSGPGPFDSAIWVEREQAVEFISILQKIVNSVEQPEQPYTIIVEPTPDMENLRGVNDGRAE